MFFLRPLSAETRPPEDILNVQPAAPSRVMVTGRRFDTTSRCALLGAVGVVPDLGVGRVAGDQPVDIPGFHAVEEAFGQRSDGGVV